MRANLALGDPSVSLDRIEKAAQFANADRFIQWLPGTFDALCGGARSFRRPTATLVVGARLVFQPEILVMDEATSSVDTETELLIQDALDKVMKDRTCLVIAHRLSTIRNADRIIVLHHGEVREMGSHAELMERRGIYYRLYQLQYEREELNSRLMMRRPRSMTDRSRNWPKLSPSCHRFEINLRKILWLMAMLGVLGSVISGCSPFYVIRAPTKKERSYGDARTYPEYLESRSWVRRLRTS